MARKDERIAKPAREVAVEEEEAPAPATVDADLAPVPHSAEEHQAHASVAASARSLTGGRADGAPDREFAAVGDPAALWTRYEAILGGTGNPATLPQLVLEMDTARRDDARDRVADAAKVASGDTMLQLGDLFDLPLIDKVRHAVAASPAPSTANLRAHLSVPTDDAMQVIADQALVAKLKAAYPGPARAWLPAADGLDYATSYRTSLIALILDTTDAELAAGILLRALSPEYLGSALNRLNRWEWVTSITPSQAAVHQETIAKLATIAGDAAAKATLTGLARPAATPAELATARRSLDDALDASPVDPAAVIAAAIPLGKTARDACKKHRADLVAAGDVESLIRLADLVELESSERIRWLLDAKAPAADFARAFAEWHEDVFTDLDTKEFEKLRAHFEGTARPEEVFGHHAENFAKLVDEKPKFFPWLLAGAPPRQLLRLLTATPGECATLCKSIEKQGIGYDWLHELGAGDADRELRILALHCPDPAAVTFIQTRLLGEETDPEVLSNDVVATPAIATASGAERLDEAIAHDADYDVDDRVDELSDGEAAALRADPDRLEAALRAVDGPDMVRIAVRLQLTLSQIFAHAGWVRQVTLPTYVRLRSDGEIVAALSDRSLTAAAQVMIGPAPLAVFAPLRAPATLAKVLGANPAMLRWILEGTDAHQALAALGDPAVAPAAAAALAADPAAAALLPDPEELPAAARSALERIRGKLPVKVNQRVGETLDDQWASDPQDREDLLQHALDEKSLVDALEEVIDDGDTGAPLLVAICRERAHTVAELFKGDTHATLIYKLAARTKLSPVTLFPDFPYWGPLQNKAGRDWLFRTEPSWVLLDATRADLDVRRFIARWLDEGDLATEIWASNLPHGSALTATERSSLRHLFDAVKTGEGARTVFEARFGSSASDLDKEELSRIWAILERLPEAHGQQGKPGSFREDDETEFGGYYQGGAVVIREGMDQVGVVPELYDEEDGDAEAWLPRATFQQVHGLTDEVLEARIASQAIRTRAGKAGEELRYATVNLEAFDAIVLHEVGHAVDDMLGEHTQLCFGLAGWRQYGEGDFEQWAKEMGGWDRVSAADQAEIRRAWLEYMGSSGAISGPGYAIGELLRSDHPAVSERYAGVGVVDLARSGKPPGHADPIILNGRAWIVNHSYQHWYSVSEMAAQAAPSEYARFAPGEFFAESYVDYYRGYDGTPATAAKKGGNLAAWIKKWFDEHVDKIGFNPDRASSGTP